MGSVALRIHHGPLQPRVREVGWRLPFPQSHRRQFFLARKQRMPKLQIPCWLPSHSHLLPWLCHREATRATQREKLLKQQPLLFIKLS